jgi:hypothetical protein
MSPFLDGAEDEAIAARWDVLYADRPLSAASTWS